MDVGAPEQFRAGAGPLRRRPEGVAARRRRLRLRGCAGDRRDRLACTNATGICSIRTARLPGWPCRIGWLGIPMRTVFSWRLRIQPSSARSSNRQSGSASRSRMPWPMLCPVRGTRCRCRLTTRRSKNSCGLHQLPAPNSQLPRREAKHRKPEPMTYRPSPGQLPDRDAIPVPYTWDLSHICQSWDEWTEGYRELDAEIEAFKSRQGTLASGAEALLDAFRAMDRMGVLSYRVWYYASLRYDEDQRNNDINARRQQVQILFAREHQSSSWFNPELLAIPLETIRQWMEASPGARALPIRHRIAVSRAGARPRRTGRAAAVLCDSLEQRVARQLRRTDDGRHEAADDRTGRRRSHRVQLRSVPRDSRDESKSGGSCNRLSSVPSGLRRQPEHLCRALQRRPAEGLVSRQSARVRDDARGGTARKQHPFIRRGDADYRHQRRVEPLRRYHRLRRRVLGSRAIGCSTCPFRSSSTMPVTRMTRSSLDRRLGRWAGR